MSLPLSVPLGARRPTQPATLKDRDGESSVSILGRATRRGFNVWGGKDPENPAQFAGKSWGTICLDSVLYSWVIPDEPDTVGPRDHYRYIQLAWSTDHAAHWTRADGGPPRDASRRGAPWRRWREDNLIIPTFLVYGKNNDSLNTVRGTFQPLPARRPAR